MNGGATARLDEGMRRARWYAKKGARVGLMVASEISGSLPLRERLTRRPRVRVLMYHRFGPARRDPFCVDVGEFDRQMAWLARHRLAISLTDFQRFLRGLQTLRDGSVMVTIDDASPTLVHEALPILADHRIPAVAFVPAGELADGERSGHDTCADPSARMTRVELALLAASGIAIGSHAWTHRSLARMSIAEMHEQAARSRHELEQWTGQAVTAFAYPFGTRADFSPAAAAVLRTAGYQCAFTAQHGAIRKGADAFVLPRVKVEGGESLRMFQLLVRGGLDPWRWIDRTLWRLQEGHP